MEETININDFSDIRPYGDNEAAQALSRVAEHPVVAQVSKALFPEKPAEYLASVLKSIKTVDEFQVLVMSRAVEWVLANTAHNFSYSGIENLRKSDRKFLAVSNHRDIILDPAITQIVLYRNSIPMTQIAVGDNLLKNKTIEDLIRSNRMIKVIRGISARSLYLSSMMLSKYIRQTITSGTSSVWIAQREGRSKNGIDTTEQGLLKMFDMSGTGDFVKSFEELNIIPMSISYEYEPCDILKARETLIRRTRDYVKGENEDIMSIVTGIRQSKGDIHLSIGEPLTREEIEEASKCQKNDRYQAIRAAVDRRVISGYRLWKTNYMAYDILNGGNRYASGYTGQELYSFRQYIESRLRSVEPELDRDALREILLGIYANPVISKEQA